ncbi:hypothetical protein Efla_007047 [Eimeria flavescens]
MKRCRLPMSMQLRLTKKFSDEDTSFVRSTILPQRLVLPFPLMDTDAGDIVCEASGVGEWALWTAEIEANTSVASLSTIGTPKLSLTGAGRLDAWPDICT